MAEGPHKSDASSIEAILLQVDDTPLGEDDFFDVKEELTPITDKWKSVGAGLRLKPSKLKEIAAAHPGSPADCLSDVVTGWLNKEYNWERFGEPTWRRIVEVVEKPAAGGNPALAQSIAKRHQVIVEGSLEVNAQGAIPNSESDSNCITMPVAAVLRQKLEWLKTFDTNRKGSAEYKTGLIRGTVQDFIDNSLRSGTSREAIEAELRELYSKDLLVSNDMYQWALKEVESSIPADKGASTESSSSPDDAKSSAPPLFCKDTLYHASLCCFAVSTCNAASYQRFFNKVYPSHCLEEVSLSRSEDREDVDRYLITRQGSTYYVAFQSEPQLSLWPEKFTSFEEGIKIQSERIPLRFFVQLLNEGHRIVFTGFSLGGLLALSVTASLWELPLLSMEILRENITCITFGQPLISLSHVKDVVQTTPEFESIVHSIFFTNDCVPRVMSFLDLVCDCAELTITLEAHQPLQSPWDKFQGPFTSMLLRHLSRISQLKTMSKTAAASCQAAASTTGEEESLSIANKLMKSAASYLLLKNGSKRPPLVGSLYLVQPETQGLSWNQMSKEKHEMGWLQPDTIDSLGQTLFEKHTMDVYHKMVLRSHLDQLPSYQIPSPVQQEIPEMMFLKPSAQAVAFHRHGNELAVVMAGENLWFCHSIQVGSRKEKVEARDVSRRSIQFNCELDSEDLGFSADSDTVTVKLESHFYNPVKKTVQVTHKAYQFTFRQEQLAKLTPSELIEVAYLGALLEQQPRRRTDHFSSRFNTLRAFLEQVVSVVPIESILHTIGYIDGLETAAKCCSALMSCSQEIPPSVTLAQGCANAYSRCYCKEEVVSAHNRDIQDKSTPTACLEVAGAPPRVAKRLVEKSYKKYKSKLVNQRHQQPQMNAYETKLQRQNFSHQYSTYWLAQHSAQSLVMQTDRDHPYYQQLQFLQLLMLQAAPTMGKHHAISGMSLQHIYPVSTATTTAAQAQSAAAPTLQPPLEILREGREKLHWLAEHAMATPGIEATRECSTSTEAQATKPSLSALYNSKMLSLVRAIREGDLRICISLLAAFMEEQIHVPLIKTSIHTAKMLNRMLAVGVWALFSLNRGDIESIVSSIPAGSLNIQVREYIGIFRQQSLTADDQYAGKLQFMVQGLEETVSCNSHYISYSLERQLVELCKNLNISSSTPLQALISDWDTIFKDDVLALVAPTHRSLIARWLKWALMVHQLREELAKYTAVGVIGLVNSGKSQLVSTLFKIRVPVGTTELKRTTVPFLYNLGDDVEGLDVIDFPGVDDRDETIPDLADLLLALAQIVIFVVDYRKVHTESAKKWLERLEEEPVPVLVCLSFADKLYANECMGTDGSHPPPEEARRKIAQELAYVEERLGKIPSRTVQYYSFCQDRDSRLNSPEGRRVLRDVGIGGPQDVGDWLVGVFENKLDQPDLGEQLRGFIHADDSGQ